MVCVCVCLWLKFLGFPWDNEHAGAVPSDARYTMRQLVGWLTSRPHWSRRPIHCLQTWSAARAWTGVFPRHPTRCKIHSNF